METLTSQAITAEPPAAAASAPAAAAGWWKWLTPVLAAAIVALVPVPAGLTPNAWRYFAMFVAVISGLIVEPIPGPAVGFLGIAVAATTRLVVAEPDASLRWAVSGFANGTVWLVFAAFVFAMGYEKTGLGRRVALGLVRRLGSRTLGLDRRSVACEEGSSWRSSRSQARSC